MKTWNISEKEHDEKYLKLKEEHEKFQKKVEYHEERFEKNSEDSWWKSQLEKAKEDLEKFESGSFILVKVERLMALEKVSGPFATLHKYDNGFVNVSGLSKNDKVASRYSSHKHQQYASVKKQYSSEFYSIDCNMVSDVMFESHKEASLFCRRAYSGPPIEIEHVEQDWNITEVFEEFIGDEIVKGETVTKSISFFRLTDSVLNMSAKDWYKNIYLQSTQWKLVRATVENIDVKCSLCGKEGKTECHHLSYVGIQDAINNRDVGLSQDKKEYLISLCHDCHEAEHKQNQQGTFKETEE